jgi:predicted anti-sigma-YlaC factor YlaD
MNCEELLAALNDYVDGDVDPAICDAFQEHLQDCNPCQIVVDNIRQTIALYKAGERVEMPEELCAELRKALRTKWQQKYPAGNT